MDNNPQLARRIRQMLETDRLLGMDRVPVSQLPQQLPGAVVVEPVAPPSPARGEGSMFKVQGSSTVPSGGRPDEGSMFDSPPTAASPTVALPGTAMSRDQKIEALTKLEQEMTAWLMADWPRDGWRKVVFGEGDPEAQLMFIGEGPGVDEDAQGRPFVGRAGQLLDKQIAAMNLERKQVYIGNIAKTRPPGNRVPTPEEAVLWMPWLRRQIDILAPKVIVALGATAAKYLLDDPKLAITRVRGQWREFNGIALMPTFHPAFLLRQYTPDNRRRVWEDLQQVMAKLGLKPKQ